MRVVEDSNKVLGEGHLQEFVDLRQSKDAHYDVSRLSYHPDDLMEDIKSRQVPEFIDEVLSEIAVGTNAADRSLLTLLSASAANYLDRHDREWYREIIEAPIEALIAEVAEARGETTLDSVRRVAVASRSQILGRIYATAIRERLDMDMAECEGLEELEAVVAKYKAIAENTLKSIG